MSCKDDNSYGHVLKYTGIFGGVQGLGIIAALVRNKAAALLLGPAGMGLASLFNTAANFMSQATSLGVSFSAVRHLSEIFDRSDAALTGRYVAVVRMWSAVAAVLGAAACLAAAPAVGRYVFDGGITLAEAAALAPVVAMIALTGGETAILKGARLLRGLVAAQVLTALASLVVAVPLYWAMGAAGIIPVLLLSTAAGLAVTARRSLAAFPLGLPGGGGLRRILAEGGGMVRLGLAFIVSGVVGSGAEMLVRSYLNTCADLATVGLYNAGYMITVTYAGMVFTAMETDYFPRLSAVNRHRAAVNLAANRQIEVSLLVISPMIVLMTAALPLLVPLLYSGRFAPVVPMAQVSLLSMYARAMMLPVAYITLAKGHSRAYMALETVSAAAIVGLMAACFGAWGLTGAGVAVLLANVFDLIVTFAYAALRYGYRPSRAVVMTAAVQVPLGAAAYIAASSGSVWVRLAVGIAATAASAGLSAYVIYKKTTLWEKIRRKVIKR